jgi:hypothetical protein
VTIDVPAGIGKALGLGGRGSAAEQAHLEAERALNNARANEATRVAERKAAEREQERLLAEQRKVQAGHRATFEQQKAEAESAIEREQVELDRLQLAAEKQAALVAECEQAASRSLAGAGLDDLMSTAGSVAEAQAKLGAAQAVLAEIRRRVAAQEPRVGQARRLVAAVQADLIDLEARVLEDEIIKMHRELVLKAKALDGLNGQVGALGITRQSVVNTHRILSDGEMLDRQYKEGRELYPAPGAYGSRMRRAS